MISNHPLLKYRKVPSATANATSRAVCHSYALKRPLAMELMIYEPITCVQISIHETYFLEVQVMCERN